MNKKKIAITMGEPGGVGPEVIVKALNRRDIQRSCSPVVIGNAETMREAVKLSKLPLKVSKLSSISEANPRTGTIEVLEVKSRLAKKNCAPCISAGNAVVKYINEAVKLALNNEVSAVVTAPISKESLKMAGHSWPGHTELLAELTQSRDFAMMFYSKRLKVILCTIHTSLKSVPGKINQKLVARIIRLAGTSMAMLGISNPRIAVAGLNPHAGESGIMGKEEIVSIQPSVTEARKQGINVSGPYPPDVIFHRACHGDFDIVVCMYHDQGLIPFKMLAFDSGVNVTVGLPIIRTSPDHGTAFDIAWKNMADPSSMIEAIKLANKMALR
jgi:4-hydroxythreonine-4-phosphate dehydrogenase